jgi:hypothetical protein
MKFASAIVAVVGVA